MSLKNFKSLPKSIYFILGNTVLERITSGGIFGKHLILFFMHSTSKTEIFENFPFSHFSALSQPTAAVQREYFDGNFSWKWFCFTCSDHFWCNFSWQLCRSLQITFHHDHCFWGWLCNFVDRCYGLFSHNYEVINFSILKFFLLYNYFRTFSFFAFFAICTGAGCCRCNFNVFGATQFNIPEQLKELNFFYTLQLCFLKFGQVIGIILFPMMRETTSCFDKGNCYSFVFMISTFLMVLAGFNLWKGKRFYVDVPPSENMLVKFCKCTAVRKLSILI